MSRIARLMPTVFTPKQYTNMIPNGDFEGTFSGWSQFSTTLYQVSDIVYRGSYSMRSAATGSTNRYFGVDVSGIVNGRVYYMATRVRQSIDDANSSILFRLSKTLTGTAYGSVNPIFFGTFDTWVAYSGVLTASSTGLVIAKFFAYDLNAWGHSIFVDNLALIDLTSEFGAGNEPSSAWCDANILPNIKWR